MFFKKANKNLFFVFLIIALLPYCYLSFFAQPMIDDFAFAAQYVKNDYVQLLKNTYQNLNGRYISSAVMYLNPISFGSFKLYKLIPILQMVLFFVVNVLFFNQFIEQKKASWFCALIITLTYLHNLPIISEGVYWFTGSVIYQLGLSISILYFSCLIKILKQQQAKSFQHFGLGFLLFLSCGFNEVLTLLILFFLAVMFWVSWCSNLRVKKIILTQLFLAIGFSCIMFLAPGNSTREEVYINNHNLLNSLGMSILQVGRFVLVWIMSIPLIALSFFYVNAHHKLKNKFLIFKQSFYLNKWVSLLLLFTIIFICVFPPYWFTGILGQQRTLNIAYYFFIVIWFVNLSVWLNDSKRLNELMSRVAKYRAVFAIFLIVGVLFTGNGFNALNDIFSGKAALFDKELAARHEILLKAQQKEPKEIIFNRVVQPKNLFVTDISNNPDFWTNRCYNEYYQLKSTRVYISNLTEDETD